MNLSRIINFFRPRSVQCLLLLCLLSLILSSVAETKGTSPNSVANSDANIPKGVIKLDARNFDSSIRDGNAWLVEFYAPWCGHCTRFASTYKEVADKLHGMHKQKPDRKVMVAKVDGAKERAISSRFNLQGYPSFFLIDGWEVRQYNGARSLEGLVKFATETYEDEEPIPFLNSPFGPIGQLRALLMYLGTKVMDCYDWLIAKGLSSVMAAAVISCAGITIGIVSVIVIGILTLPKVKED